ncbi:FkbM family methyltransferase [Campylobacter insulaenigrae]|uniref:FkbM family methyltransferase n=1 Tax=Campylobacter insulaenigrae TaxID=260714 RepID=UPI0021539993|nr:FkbM family methyltransferase [Campylobacter insulaenigrae]MCR6585067.1 FkbM family methyltransferase [Campylobacter insulaenigrae]
MKKYLFRIFKFFPLSKNKVVFIAHSATRFDCNPKAIFEELLKNKTKVKYVWILNKKFHEEYKNKYPMVSFVSPGSFKAFFHLSTCRVFINNQIHVYYKKMGFTKRPEQLYLQTWHGSFGMKHIPISDDFNIVHSACVDIDYWLTNSIFESNVYKNTFDKNAKFLEIGHARSDFLFSNQTKKIHDYYNLQKETKIILYAPTKRDNMSNNYNLDFTELKNIFENKFDCSFVILIRMHRNLRFEIKNENIIDAFDYPDVMELIQECDILISDYSSIICDFALTYKPIFIYASDYDTFVLTTKLYYDYSKLPFGLAKNFQELEKYIKNFNYENYKQKLRKWLEDVGCIEDGKAGKKISKLITQFINKDKNINLYTTNQITPYIAKIMGFDSIYFTFRNIGDQIIMMRSLELLYQKTKQFFLIGTTLPDLWKEVKFVKVINLKEIKLHIYQKEQFDLMVSYGIRPIFLTQESFNKEKGRYIRTYGPSHIVANVCSKLGLEGDIAVDLNFPLSEKEKTFGRFAPKNRKQIAVISGGLQRYKTYPFEKLQEVINSLQEKYDFIQIGTKKDLPLRGVLDLREKLTLREVASTLYNSDLFIGGIGGLMHMANAVGCPSVVLYSEAEPRYIVNYNNNINVFPVDNSCIKCTEGKHCPWTSPCKADGQKYSCIDNIKVEDIIQAIEKRINLPRNLNNPTVYYAQRKKIYGLEEQRKVGFSFQYSGKRGIYIDSKKDKNKKVLQLVFLGIKPISFLWGNKYYKLRLFNIHISLDKATIKFRIGKKKAIVNYNHDLFYNIGYFDWIKGYENYCNQFLNFQKYFDKKSLELLHYIFQMKLMSKKTNGRYIQTEYYIKKEELARRNELIGLNHSIGKIFFEGNPMNIYAYSGFVILMRIQNSYALLHDCFIKKKYDTYIKNNDIIDVGTGSGLSSLCLSKYTDKYVYSFEASSKIYELFQECIKLNNKQNKIMSYNVAVGSKRQPIYISDDINNRNTTSLNVKSSSVLMDTMDDIVNKLNIRPKMINIWVNGDEYECLLGMRATIKNFRPILHINISKSSEILFSVVDFVVKTLEGYDFKIKKTIEPHIVQELFLIAIPKELK